MYAACAPTPLGRLCAAAEDGKAFLIDRPGKFASKASRWSLKPGGEAVELLGEIIEYASGRRERFTFTPVYPRSGFAGAVLNVVSRIPRGRTLTYGEVAAAAGRPGAARAVGTVLNRNPVPILVPCHRVVGKNGMGGYGLGLGAKILLLAVEGALTPALSL